MKYSVRKTSRHVENDWVLFNKIETIFSSLRLFTPQNMLTSVRAVPVDLGRSTT